MQTVDPSSLSLQIYPEPILRQRAVEVDAVDDSIRHVARRMIEMMFEHEGIGLAAPQAGLGIRLFVAHVPFDSDDPDACPTPDHGLETPANATAEPLVFINPELAEPSRQMTPLEEGCLSLPEIRGEVIRPETIRVRATGLDGKPFELFATDLLAKVIQHENDHLDGTLIIDRMTQMSRLKVRSAVRQLERNA